MYAGGWFARNAQVLRKVGEVLLEPSAKQDAPLTRWLTAADAFYHSDKATSQAIYKARAWKRKTCLHVAHPASTACLECDLSLLDTTN